MKIINKIALIVYSSLILIASILTCLLVFGWLDFGLVSELVQKILTGPTSSNIVLAVSILFILISVLCIFFDSSSSKESKNTQGVLLENDSGKLMISKDTLENLVNSVAKDFGSAEEINTKVEIDKENNLRVFINLIVSPNAVIKELSNNLQIRIKEAVKNASDLDVKEVNIKVKNIAPKKDIVQE